MTKLEITFGTELDRSCKPLDPALVSDALDQLTDLALNLWGGVSITHGNGAWRSATGVRFVERNATFTVIATPASLLGPNGDFVKEFVIRVKQALCQEAVLVVQTEVRMEVI